MYKQLYLHIINKNTQTTQRCLTVEMNRHVRLKNRKDVPVMIGIIRASGGPSEHCEELAQKVQDAGQLRGPAVYDENCLCDL